jgi:hypothetical protein
MEYQQASDPMLQQILLAQNEGQQASPAQTTGGIRPLTQDEIKEAVQSEINDALGAYGSVIHEQRRTNLRRYYGKPLGNEVEGQSQAQMSTVADAVEWMMPSLMKSTFGSTRNIWDFQPTRPGEEQMAAQASDVVNHIFRNECGGFEKVYDMFKTALLEKRGYLAVFYEEVFEPTRETYRGVSEQALGMLGQDPNAEMVEFGPHEGEAAVDPMTGQPVETFDVTVRRTKKRGRIVIDSIAPENMLLARRETTLDDNTQFSGYRKRMTVGELISLGYDPDVVSTLPSGNSRAEFSQGRMERLHDENSFPTDLTNRSDGASRELWVNFIWIRLDEDGDGFAELRNIVCVGDAGTTILDDREVARIPFVSVCPIPMPHKYQGQCPADSAADIQVIESTVLRQILDNMYRINNGRFTAVEGQVNMKDLVENKPGGIVRISQPGAVDALQTPALPNSSFEMLNFMQSVGEKRIGVSSWQQGPDAADMKYQTSGAVSNVQTASEGRISLINQIFAMTGVKALGIKIYQLIVENAMAPFLYRLHGTWAQADPRSWNRNMDCTVEAGMGVGDMEQRMQKLSMVQAMQSEMLKNGLRSAVTPRNIYNVAKEMVKVSGVGLEGYFFTDPGDQPWPEPQPDFVEQVKFKESDRRALEDKNVDNQATLALAVQASSQQDMARYRYAELDTKERIEAARIVSQREVVEMQMRAQIESAMVSRNQTA